MIVFKLLEALKQQRNMKIFDGFRAINLIYHQSILMLQETYFVARRYVSLMDVNR